MSSPVAPFKIYFVMGEESGDVLGADLMEALHSLDTKIEPVGLGGERMQERGLNSLFDISALSVMGFSDVLKRLPSLMRRLDQTVEDIAKQAPDLLLLIDSPEFSYRVASRVRKRLPRLPIVKYVAPSVWAWRPGRAKKIAAYVDHVLALLPFEPDILRELNGPEATYVGHPLSAKIPDIDPKSRKRPVNDPVNLVILPGSRRGEAERLLPFLTSTLSILKERGNEFKITVPAVAKLKDRIESEVSQWPFETHVVSGDEARHDAFMEADLALAASGTVILELALYRIPMISIYKLDGIALRLRHLLTGWTAALPNLIADYPVVPERYNEYAHPQYVARMVERLCLDGPERQIQLKGFETVIERVDAEEPASLVAARTILKVAGRSE